MDSYAGINFNYDVNHCDNNKDIVKILLVIKILQLSYFSQAEKVCAFFATNRIKFNSYIKYI